MVADRLGREEEPLSDFAVMQALRQESEYLDFARRQARGIALRRPAGSVRDAADAALAQLTEDDADRRARSQSLHLGQRVAEAGLVATAQRQRRLIRTAKHGPRL